MKRRLAFAFTAMSITPLFAAEPISTVKSAITVKSAEFAAVKADNVRLSAEVRKWHARAALIELQRQELEDKLSTLMAETPPPSH